MSSPTYPRRAAAIAFLVGTALVVGTACGGSSQAPRLPSSTSSTSSTSATGTSNTSGEPTLPPELAALGPDGTCLVGTGARAVVVNGLPVAVVGHGPRGVVFADQSDQNYCPWLPLATRLARSGYRVALFSYQAGPVDDLRNVSSYLRSHGVRRLGLVGASEGAKAVLVASASGRRRPEAVVSLSPEEVLTGRDVADSIPGIRSPLLLVTAARDPLGSADATAGFARLSRARPTRRLVEPGVDHGTDLLAHRQIMTAVMAFLADHLRG